MKEKVGDSQIALNKVQEEPKEEKVDFELRENDSPKKEGGED